MKIEFNTQKEIKDNVKAIERVLIDVSQGKKQGNIMLNEINIGTWRL